MSNYPCGASLDSNAPFNQPSSSSFEAYIHKIVNNEIDNLDGMFMSWVQESILKVEIRDESSFDEIVKSLSAIDYIRELYHSYRDDDVACEKRDNYYDD